MYVLNTSYENIKVCFFLHIFEVIIFYFLINRRTGPFRWLTSFCCCKDNNPENPSGRRMLRSQRTFTSSTMTTSLSAARSTTTSIHRPNKVVNFDRQNTILGESNERWHIKEYSFQWPPSQTIKLKDFK